MTRKRILPESMRGKVKSWPGFVIETPTEKRKIYGARKARNAFDHMVKLWARQTGQSVVEMDVSHANSDDVWPRQAADVDLIYTLEGQPTSYGHMILWEQRYADRKHATSGKRSGRRIA